MTEKQTKFLEAYKELAKAHGCDFYAALDVTAQGIRPVIMLKEVNTDVPVTPA